MAADKIQMLPSLSSTRFTSSTHGIGNASCSCIEVSSDDPPATTSRRAPRPRHKALIVSACVRMYAWRTAHKIVFCKISCWRSNSRREFVLLQDNARTHWIEGHSWGLIPQLMGQEGIKWKKGKQDISLFSYLASLFLLIIIMFCWR